MTFEKSYYFNGQLIKVGDKVNFDGYQCTVLTTSGLFVKIQINHPKKTDILEVRSKYLIKIEESC